MQIAATGRMVSQINMTPMIDVLLVLIIICLVVLPGTTTGLPASVPEDSPNHQQAADLESLVISVSAGPKYEVNGHAVERTELSSILQRTLTERHNKDLFIRGAKELEYQEVARVIDIARGAGPPGSAS
jgi:biopolymer transport protein ExbD